MKSPIKIFIIFCLVHIGYGCTSMQSFSTVARPGDTIAVALGWLPDLSRQDITVTITDSNATTYVYAPNDPSIRAFINSYPDPLSNLVVGHETGQNIVGFEVIWGSLVDGAVTGGDSDWSQSMLVLDLPSSILPGTATIQLSTSGGAILNPATVEILNVGVGAPHTFSNWEGANVTADTLKSLERANHYKISFTGSVIPHAIQLDLMHNPDVDNGGVGRAYLVNTRGDIKNITWDDDGTNMRVIILPTQSQTLDGMSDLNFYIAGEITGLVATNVQGFDSSGSPISGLSVDIQ